MTTTRAIALACLALSLAAYTSTSSFAGNVTGGLRAVMHGDATFGVVDGHGATPSVFTLSLGRQGQRRVDPVHPDEWPTADPRHLRHHRPGRWLGRRARARS